MILNPSFLESTLKKPKINHEKNQIINDKRFQNKSEIDGEPKPKSNINL